MSASLIRPLAVVTGASSGIGFELAKQFAGHGYDLIICAEDKGIEDAAQTLAQTGIRVETVQADLSEPEGVQRLYSQIQSSNRAVEAIAINAGVGIGGAFIETDLSAELKMIALNNSGAVYLAKLIAKDMATQRKGRILFTSSIAATMPAPFEAVYGATKAFLLSFSDALRNEMKDYGVTVTALMPGPTETNFFHRAGLDDTKVGQDEKDNPADVARQGFEALMNGEGHVLAASFKTKMMGLMNELAPEGLKAAMHRNLSEPGSGTKQ